MAERKQSESSHRGGSSNFAEDPEKASEAGRKGGEHSGGGRSASSGSTHPGGSGNFAEDRERASEAGRKGGQSRSDR